MGDLTIENQSSSPERGFVPSGELFSNNYVSPASSSAMGSVLAGASGIVSAKLWLPEIFHDLVSSFIENDDDRIHASGLQRCLEAMHCQVAYNSGISLSSRLRRRLGKRSMFS